MLSIITVCYNAESSIEKTILSIIENKFLSYEIIIIDGGSTDKTLSILNKYKSKIKIIISEKDFGIYDAMNKGIKLANGNWVYFLNSGDVLNKEFNFFEFEYTHYSILAFSCEYIYENLKILYEPRELKIGRMPASHQAIFIKKSIIINFPFNLNYKVAADYDQLERILNNTSNSICLINNNIATIDGFGYSTDNVKKYIFEYFLIIKCNYGYLIGILWLFKKIILTNINIIFKKLIGKKNTNKIRLLQEKI
jgi:glycosyltransferase involved in cell wall biosynthesis